MNKKPIAVPHGMLTAGAMALKAVSGPNAKIGPAVMDAMAVLEAALEWLQENPIVPTSIQIGELFQLWDRDTKTTERTAFLIAEWQRRMFCAPTTINSAFGPIQVDERVPQGEIRLGHWDGPTLIRNLEVERNSDGSPDQNPDPAVQRPKS